MTVAFYFDDNCADTAVVRGLLRASVSAVASVDTGTYGAADTDHLEYAAANNLTLVTSDVDDFARLSADWLRSGRSHSGIVIVRQQHFTVREQIRRLLRIHTEVSLELIAGRIEFLTHWPGAADRKD